MVNYAYTLEIYALLVVIKRDEKVKGERTNKSRVNYGYTLEIF